MFVSNPLRHIRLSLLRSSPADVLGGFVAESTCVFERIGIRADALQRVRHFNSIWTWAPRYY